METKFGGRGFSVFGDFARFQIWPNCPFNMDYSPQGQKIESAQKIHASRG